MSEPGRGTWYDDCQWNAGDVTGTEDMYRAQLMFDNLDEVEEGELVISMHIRTGSVQGWVGRWQRNRWGWRKDGDQGGFAEGTLYTISIYQHQSEERLVTISCRHRDRDDELEPDRLEDEHVRDTAERLADIATRYVAGSKEVGEHTDWDQLCDILIGSAIQAGAAGLRIYDVRSRLRDEPVW